MLHAPPKLETTSRADPVMRLAASLRHLKGWRRAAVAAGLGIAATAALPPVYLVPLLVVAFTGLVWMVEGAEGDRLRAARRAFAIGWWFGVGHFATGLYWVAHALLVDAAKFGWMIPFAIFSLAAGLGLFVGLATALLRLSGARGVAGALVLAVAWTVAEWLRGHIFTGFPWNLIGSAWASFAPMMQPASVVGLYGLGTLTVLIAALPATLAAPSSGLRRAVPTLAGVVLLAVLWGGGALRLADAVPGHVPGVRLRLVQPDIPQSLKWDPTLREQHLLHTMQLTHDPGFGDVTHVIWPEAASAFPLSGNASLRQALATVVPPGGLLITGAPRTAGQRETFQVWNSLYAIDRMGDIVATYDKFHLVPFGEYVPLRGILPISKITPGIADFSAGPGPRTLALPGLPDASPLICYEIIFPGNVVDPAHRPGWLLNVTNDAWFGISSGPYQHFASARFRAVEEGLPLVRAANDGISAVVDPYGRVTAELGLGRMGVLDADLPNAIAATPYARFGDGALLVLVLMLGGLAGLIGGRVAYLSTAPDA